MKLHYLASVRFPTERARAAQIAHTCNAFAQNWADVIVMITNRTNSVKEDAFSYLKTQKIFSVQYIFCTSWNAGSKFSFYSKVNQNYGR